MLIKAADDKKSEIDALEALLSRSTLSDGTRKKIDEEIWAIREGAKTEADAAYEIEFNLGSSNKAMTIHDLRIEVEGRIAQIDHLIITRLFDIWVCESKAFTRGVSINEHGEWSSYRGKRLIGIPSPIEQNRRHIQVLNDVFARGIVKLPSRLGMTLKPHFESMVLVSNRGMISRPRSRANKPVGGIDRVIKVEQLLPTVDRKVDDMDAGGMAVAVLTMVGSETIERIARELAALHKPAMFNWAARFGVVDWVPSTVEGTPASRPQAAPMGATPDAPTTATTMCQSCGDPVSEKVATYCRVNATRLNGQILCYQCQRKPRPA